MKYALMRVLPLFLRKNRQAGCTFDIKILLEWFILLSYPTFFNYTRLSSFLIILLLSITGRLQFRSVWLDWLRVITGATGLVVVVIIFQYLGDGFLLALILMMVHNSILFILNLLEEISSLWALLRLLGSHNSWRNTWYFRDIHFTSNILSAIVRVFLEGVLSIEAHKLFWELLVKVIFAFSVLERLKLIWKTVLLILDIWIHKIKLSASIGFWFQ